MNDQPESYTVNVSPVRIVACYYLTFIDGRIMEPGRSYDTETEAMIALAAHLAGHSNDYSLCVKKAYYRTFVTENLQLDAVTPSATKANLPSDED